MKIGKVCKMPNQFLIGLYLTNQNAGKLAVFLNTKNGAILNLIYLSIIRIFVNSP